MLHIGNKDDQNSNDCASPLMHLHSTTKTGAARWGAATSGGWNRLPQARILSTPSQPQRCPAKKVLVLQPTLGNVTYGHSHNHPPKTVIGCPVRTCNRGNFAAGNKQSECINHCHSQKGHHRLVSGQPEPERPIPNPGRHMPHKSNPQHHPTPNSQITNI